jgi:hypothetical protein
MPFIGNQPALSYTSFAKQDFTTSVTTSYTLDNPVANANELALFINFVRQEPTTAYSASGTSLTLTSATSATDDMYCVFLGKAVQTVNPPSGSVGISQLSATGTKDATTFLRGDNTFDTPPLGGITEYDMFRLTSDFQDSATITSNLERVDTNFEKIGTGMTESSGVFTFPSTGKYEVRFTATAKNPDATGTRNYVVNIQFTTDNSSYSNVASSSNNIGYYSSSVNNWQTTSAFVFLDITDTSNMKVKFDVVANGNSNAYTQSSTTNNITYMTFIKIGNT